MSNSKHHFNKGTAKVNCNDAEDAEELIRLQKIESWALETNNCIQWSLDSSNESKNNWKKDGEKEEKEEDVR